MLPDHLRERPVAAAIADFDTDAIITGKYERNELTLEIALEYIESDELVEITPTKLRLRKKVLSEEGRKRADRGGKKVGV